MGEAKRKKEAAERKMKEPSTISLCMIVKDEEKRLPDSLRSTLPLVDEVIVVDTGSTDNTLAILADAQREWKEQLGKEGNFLILHRAWENDFSAARNYGILHATGSWILQIDADECIDEQTSPLLREAANRGWDGGDLADVGAFFFNLYNVLADGRRSSIYHPHLFRRIGIDSGLPFRFTGKVHNRPSFEGPAHCCPMVIYHYGYGEDEATMRRKHERRKIMVGEWLQNDPDGFWPHFYMAQTWASELGDAATAKTIYHSKRALDILPGFKDAPTSSGARCYYSWLMALMRDKKAVDVVGVSIQAIAELPWYPDTYFFLAWAYCQLGEWELCFKACTTFFDVQEQAQQDANQAPNFVGVENQTMDHASIVVGFWRYATHEFYGMAKPEWLTGAPEVKVNGLEPIGDDAQMELSFSECKACAL